MSRRLWLIRAGNRLAGALSWLAARLTDVSHHLTRCENCGGRTYYDAACFGKPPK